MRNQPCREMLCTEVNVFPHQGKEKQEILQIRKTNLVPGLLTFYKDPVYVHQGHMQWLWDTTGKRYLDLFAGIVTVSVGHCHP